MVDSSVTSIFSAILLDLVIFCILFTIFLLYRKLRSPIIELEVEIPLKKSFFHEGRQDFFSLFKKIYSMSLPQVYSSIGEWGFIYLTLHKYIIYVLLSYSLLAFPVLLIVYALGSSDVDVDSSKIGISHVIENERFLIAPILFIFVLSAFMAGFIFYYFTAATEQHSDEIVHHERAVVKITNIPMNFPPEFVNYRIRKLIMKRYAKKVREIYTVPCYDEAYRKYLEKMELEESLKKYEFKLRESGKRPKKILKSLNKVDAIEYTKDEIEEVEEKMIKAKEQGLYMNSGKAFLFCKSEKAAKHIIDLRAGADDILASTEWSFGSAPNSGSINWQNIGTRSQLSYVTLFLYNAVFVILFLMILTPTTFTYVIITIFSSIGGGEVLEGIIEVYLPSLLLLVYQQVILPEAVEFIVSHESHSYKSGEISSGLRKYLFYLVFYIFIYPLFGLQFIEFIKIFFDNNIDWEEEFANSVNESGQFFTVFLIHECFIKNAWDLMVTGKYFKAKAKAMIATTQEERAMAYQAEDFKFDLELAISLNVLIIVCSFGVVYPLVVVPGLGFFALRYFVHKHNLLAVFYVNKTSSAFPVLFSVLCSIAIALFAMQVLTGAVLILSGVNNYHLVAKLIVPASCCELVLSFLYFRNLVKKRKIELLSENESLIEVDSSEYKHPIDKLH